MKPHELSDALKNIVAEVCQCQHVWSQTDKGRNERGPVTRDEADRILLKVEELMEAQFKVTA